MAVLDGSQIDAGLVKESTHGTAVQAATGGKLKAVSITHNQTAAELPDNPIGSGQAMPSDSEIGRRDNVVSIDMRAGYQNSFPHLAHAFLQTSSSPSEQNVGEGDYLHRFTFSRPSTQLGHTIAFETSSTTTLEYISCYATALNIYTEDVPGRLRAKCDFIAATREDATSTNTNANLASATEVDSELAVATYVNDFLINTQSGGALSDSTDLLAITQYNLQLTQPRSFPAELRGAAEPSTPVYDGDFVGTLTVTLRNQSDNTYFAAHDAETEYKCSLLVDGTQIAAGDNKSIAVYIPKMKLIQSPQSDKANAGNNPMTLTFNLYDAVSNPTGMDDATPYIEVINTRSSQY